MNLGEAQPSTTMFGTPPVLTSDRQDRIQGSDDNNGLDRWSRQGKCLRSMGQSTLDSSGVALDLLKPQNSAALRLTQHRFPSNDIFSFPSILPFFRVSYFHIL